MNKRPIALARTLLFNYGQGIWTPHRNFLNLCKLLSTESRLVALPDLKVQRLDFPRISFFSKTYLSGFRLCAFSEEAKFNDLAPAPKLNWFRNFCFCQELLLHFSPEELVETNHILFSWKRPSYNYLTVPFQISREEEQIELEASDV